jgi:serine phosphatase RsbU (regulator of sigma subunit)
MKKPAILCVDDEIIVLNSLKAELRVAFGERFIIEVAENATDALEIFTDLLVDDVEVPLVISDYIMPDMKGDELLTKIHKTSPDCIKILLTGEAHIEGITNAINNADLYRYITKPWDKSYLIVTIEEAVKTYYKNKKLLEYGLQMSNMNLMLAEKTRELEKTLAIVSQQQEELIATNAIIHSKNKSIHDSIQYARRIQTAISPRIVDIQAHLPNSFVIYKPKDVVSGDIYWFDAQKNRVILTVIDCTGHGVPGAFMTMIANNLMNEIVHSWKIEKPDEILTAINNTLINTFKNKEMNIRDGMDMAICVLYKEQEKYTHLEYAGAMNPLYYVQNNEIHTIKADRRAIGYEVNEQQNTYTLHSIKLDIPTVFYICTDGFQDQFGGENRQKFMSRNLKDVFLTISDKDVQEQEEILVNTFETWQGIHPQIDDVLIIGVKV